MVVLDTNFLIALETGEQSAISWLERHQHEEHVVPDIVAIEYLTGHDRWRDALEAIEESFRIVNGDRAWIEETTQWRKELRKRGKRFRAPDFWIAAWAHHLDTPVMTRNTRHFEPFTIEVITW